MLLATEGSILASCLAIDMGWAVNLSGGFHHASWDKGEGFCIYPDISLAVHYLKTRRGIKKIMIIDLDAHQGNGY
jgi:histone deacetylase 11